MHFAIPEPICTNWFYTIAVHCASMIACGGLLQRGRAVVHTSHSRSLEEFRVKNRYICCLIKVRPCSLQRMVDRSFADAKQATQFSRCCVFYHWCSGTLPTSSQVNPVLISIENNCPGELIIRKVLSSFNELTCTTASSSSAHTTYIVGSSFINCTSSKTMVNYKLSWCCPQIIRSII